MRRVLGTTITTLTLSTLAATSVAAPAGGTAPDPHDQQLQDRLDSVVATGAVGALAQVRDGRHRWRGTSGMAEVGTPRPVPVTGRFRAGSVTKTFVAVVVLQLADERRLDLDDPVDRWLPGVVPNGAPITIRQLLNHTSGLPDVVPTLPMPPNPAFYANR